MEEQDLKPKLKNKIVIGSSSVNNHNGTVSKEMALNFEQETCPKEQYSKPEKSSKEQYTKLEYMYMKHIASKLKEKGKVKSLFVKTMDKGNPRPQPKFEPEVNGSSPVTKDPELLVLCSMLDESHTNAIMRLHLQEKLQETGKKETSLSRALKKYYSKLLDSEYRLTIMQCDQISTKTIMANLIKDRKRIIDFIGGEEVAVRLIEQRQNKCKQRKAQVERYIKNLHKDSKAMYFYDNEMDEITKDKIMEELTLEIKADIEQYVDKKYQTEIYEKLLNNIKATQIVEELECHLLLEPSSDCEKWLEDKWKELAEIKGTRKATEITDIVHRTMVEENMILKLFRK